MIRVGLVDSGVDAGLERSVGAARSFTGHPLVPDPVGHGSVLARIILGHHPATLILNAQAFGTAPASAEAVAQATRWVIREGAAIANLSLGLRHDRGVLRAAVEAALAAGVTVLAGVAARGPVPFPAAYPGVIRITGDARCGPDELSALGAGPADYGACVLGPDGRPGGASLAVAHASGLLARELAVGRDVAPPLLLDRLVVYRGRERRR